MSREFKPEVTEGMEDEVERATKDWFSAAAEHCNGGPMPEKYMPEMIKAALAHPDFRRQLRKWAAEEMRGLVAKKTTPDSYHSNERARARVWNACRAETIANIEAWEKRHD